MCDYKKKIAVMFSAMLSLASMGTMAFDVSAEENKTVTAAVTSAADENEESVTSLTSNIETTETTNENIIGFDEMLNLFGAVIEGEVKQPVDYYADDYYDTDGNASLIKEENIIYNNEKMQFIAVTTKDGNVFYILINYSAEEGEDNVYFLNKVDDFDLYSLLYAKDENDENSENINPAEQAALYADAATNGHFNSPYKYETTPEITETEVTAETEAVVQTNGMTTNNLILIIGIIVLGGIGAVIYLLKSGKIGGNKKKTDDIGDFEEDDYADYGEVEDENE